MKQIVCVKRFVIDHSTLSSELITKTVSVFVTRITHRSVSWPLMTTSTRTLFQSNSTQLTSLADLSWASPCESAAKTRQFLARKKISIHLSFLLHAIRTGKFAFVVICHLSAFLHRAFFFIVKGVALITSTLNEEITTNFSYQYQKKKRNTMKYRNAENSSSFL